MKYFLFLLASVALFFGCNQIAELEDIERSDYQAEYAIPLVNTSFSMSSILENFEENSVLHVDPDGLLRLRYRGDVLTQTSEDIFSAINEQSSVPIPITETYQVLPYDLSDGLEFDRMDLDTGTISFLIENCNNVPITVTITMPTVTLNDEPLTIVRNLPAHSGTGNCPSLNNALFPIDLSEYVVSPGEDGIVVTYLAVDTDGNEYEPTGNNFLLLGNLRFTYAEGYLGMQDHSSSRDTIDIDFFDNWIQGDVCFEDPTITLHFENSFGLPTRSVIQVFQIETVEGDILPLESEFVTNGVDFPYPELDEVGLIALDSFSFNNDNSNIKDILCGGPIALDYHVDAVTNPTGNPNIRGFVTDSSYYKVQVEVDLPFYGSATDFTVRDTISLAFDNYDEIDYAEFKLVTDNGMPISIDVQGYFLDAGGVVLDSLLAQTERIIAGTPVDADGLPTANNVVTTFSLFDAARFGKVKKAATLEVVATFATSTDGQQPVRVLADQDVTVKIGAILGRSNQ